MNRVEGQPLFLKDPNCKCINPKMDLVLNPAAWADPPEGHFGYSAAYYNDYRWQRHVTENLSLGRRFPIKERISFEVRAEFCNVFDRSYLRMPTDFNNNPLTRRSINLRNELTDGFGYINWTAAQTTNPINNFPRNGQLVARIVF